MKKKTIKTWDMQSLDRFAKNLFFFLQKDRLEIILFVKKKERFLTKRPV